MGGKEFYDFLSSQLFLHFRSKTPAEFPPQSPSRSLTSLPKFNKKIQNVQTKDLRGRFFYMTFS